MKAITKNIYATLFLGAFVSFLVLAGHIFSMLGDLANTISAM